MGNRGDSGRDGDEAKVRVAGSCGTHMIPKFLLFDWLTQLRPQGDPCRRWRNVVRKDLREVKIGEEEWYDGKEIQGRMEVEGEVQTGALRRSMRLDN